MKKKKQKSKSAQKPAKKVPKDPWGYTIDYNKPLKYQGRPAERVKMKKKPRVDDDSEIDKYVAKATEATRDPITGRPDPLVKLAQDWLPIIAQFAKGFIESAQANKQSQPQQQAIMPPDGWVGMGALQKLQRKHTHLAWYEAGLRYDAVVSGGGYVPQAQPQYVPPPQRPALVDRTSELPLVDASPQPQQAQPEPAEHPPEAGSETEMEESMQETQAVTPQTQAEGMLEMLTQKLASTEPKLVVEYGKKDADEIKRLFGSYKDFVAPAILREMLRRPWNDDKKGSPRDGMLDFLMRKCPKQMNALNEAVLLPKLGEIYDEMREKVVTA